MKVAIVGSGLIGNKRADNRGSHELIIVADTDLSKAAALADKHGNIVATKNWRDAVTHPDVDIVIVATTPNHLAEITQGAVEAGKHVLVDKPAARNHKELEPVLAATRSNTNAKVRVGFNHRFHPAMLKAREIHESGAMGELMFIRGRYGHGGRLGYDKEWRANREIAGGGELLDQGMHLIDLSRYFLGDFPVAEGFINTYYWDMPVEDNAFLTLRTESEQVAWLHVSCTEWKNMFSLEIYGRTGKLQIDGLGGSYGTERLTYYQMLPQMGPPEVISWEFSGPDRSWQLELEALVDDITLDREPAPNINDAYEALKIVDRIYEKSLTATASSTGRNIGRNK
jgi:predicted dehydrogenase